MEELTPELERRIQVEELWGRRVVLEESMNTPWRSREYKSRRLFCLLRDEADDVRPVRAAPAIDRPKPQQPAKRLNVISLRRAAVLAGLSRFAPARGVQQAGGKLLAWGLNFVTPNAVSASNVGEPRDRSAHLENRTVAPGNTPSEVHGLSKPGWPLDADLKKIFGSSL